MCPSNWLAEAVTISLGDRFEEGFSGRVEYGHFELRDSVTVFRVSETE